MYNSHSRDPNDVHREYKDELDKAEQALDTGNSQRAANHYRNAADAREELGRIQGADYSSRVRELRQIASRAEKGDRISRVDGDDGPETLNDGQQGDGAQGSHPADDMEGDSSEFREVIESFIVETDVAWSDVGGLEETKQELREALALGAVRDKPDAVEAAESNLLFGPPGTGKTMLAKAVANETNAVFFSVKLGSLLSKWYGQSSQKIIKLFEVAKELSPSVIFLDEIDAITTSRGSGGDDASRRVLNTILSELSELQDHDSFTFVLANTNTPWDLDFAVVRRFSHRTLVPLPDPAACAQITRVHTTEGGVSFEGDPTKHIPTELRSSVSDATSVPEAIGHACHERQFTGSDIAGLAERMTTAMVHRTNPNLAQRASEDLSSLTDASLDIAPIQPEETRTAFQKTNPSLSGDDIARFHEWNEEYGTG